VVLSEDGRVAADGPAEAVLADTDLLLAANLIHRHRHRHGSVYHSHPHPAGEERHVHPDGVR
jgi:cobalt/nickel transport system ATP-binding protein